MCSGKSTLGPALAERLGVEFVDLDDCRERRHGMSIVELFASVGESRFRELESAMLEDVVAGHSCAVVACGGGTPCVAGNMELMNRSGLTVWLTTSAERIASRLCLPEHKSRRPLIASLRDDEVLAYVRRDLALREPHYSRAQLQFDSTRIETAAETAETADALAGVVRSITQGT